MTRTTAGSIDEYIALFSPPTQAILNQVRALIRELVPEAGEKISYQIPTFTLDGNLIHFAAFKTHLGLYPPVRGDAALARETAPYRGEKGNFRFPLDRPIPFELIGRIVRARLVEHREYQTTKAAGKRR